MIVNINGKLRSMGDVNVVSYGDIVNAAGYKPERVLTVTYRTTRAGDEQRQGTMTPGQTVKCEERMVFNVADTSNA